MFNTIKKIWSGPEGTSLDTDVSLGYSILSALKNTPDRVLQVSDDTGVELTCKDVYKRCIAIAQYLSMELKLKECDVVGFVCGSSENVQACAFACFTMGYPINPLSTVMNKDEIVYMFSITKPKVIFCDGIVAKKVLNAIESAKLEIRMITLNEVEEVLVNFSGNENDFVFPKLSQKALAMAAIQCSSGTSSKTKGIMKSHKQILNFSVPWHDALKSNTIFFDTSLYWTIAYWAIIASTIYGEKQVITKVEMNAERFYGVVKRQKPTVIQITPFFGKSLLALEGIAPLESVELLIILGSTFSKEFLDELKIIFPNASIGGCYGCTEGDVLTFTKNANKSENGLGHSGSPVENVEMKIIDDEENSLGPNEKGEICYKSATLFTGYFNEPELTAAAFDADGFAYSGDIGYFDEEGFIHVIARKKFMLKNQDFTFTPKEVEEVINQIPGILASCVVGVYDEALCYDVIYAFVIKEENRNDIDEKIVIDYVAENAAFMKHITGRVIFMDKFPLTPTSKIRFCVLKEKALEIHEGYQK